MNTAPLEDATRFRLKFTTLAHQRHLFCSPMSGETAELLLNHLNLDRKDRIVDIGCGKGELLIRLARRSEGEGVGIDRSAAFLTTARERAQEAGVAHQLSFLEQDAATYTPDATGFTAGLCIGAGAAFGLFADVARHMSRLVRPGGLLLIGECYWKREPAAEYLQFLGADRACYSSHEGNLELARQLQLAPLWSTVSSDAEWDAYEDLYRSNIEDYVASNSDDPDGPAMIQRVRIWNRMYRDHGRSTLGFGFYLLRNSGSNLPE